MWGCHILRGEVGVPLYSIGFGTLTAMSIPSAKTKFFPGIQNKIEKDHFDLFKPLLDLFKDEKGKWPVHLYFLNREAKVEVTSEEGKGYQVKVRIPFDNDKKSENGRMYIEDTYQFDDQDNLKTAFRKSFTKVGPGGPFPQWSNKLAGQLLACDGKNNRGGVCIDEKDPRAQKFAKEILGRYIGKTVASDGKLYPEAKDAYKDSRSYFIKIYEQAAKEYPHLEFPAGDPSSRYSIAFKGNDLEIRIRWVLRSQNGNGGKKKIFVDDTYVLNGKDFSFKSHERDWGHGGKGEPILSAEALERLNAMEKEKVSKGEFGEEKRFIEKWLPVLLPGYLKEKYDELLSDRLQERSSVVVDKKSVQEENLEKEIESSKRRDGGVRELLPVLEEMAKEELHQRYLDRGVIARLRNSVDQEGETKAIDNVFKAADQELKSNAGKYGSIVDILSGITLENKLEKQVVRNLLSQRWMQRFNHLSMDLDDGIRGVRLLSFAQDELLRHKMIKSAGKVAEQLKDRKSLERVVKEVADYAAEKGSNWVKAEYLLAQMGEDLLKPEMLAGFLVAPLAGAYLEGALLKLLGKSFLGKMISGALSVVGESAVFVSVGALWKTPELSTRKELGWWGALWREWVLGSAMIGGMRLFHAGSAVAKNQLMKSKIGIREVEVRAAKNSAQQELAASPLGRVHTGTTAPKLPESASGKAWELTLGGKLGFGAMDLASGVGAMYVAGAIGRKLKWQNDHGTLGNTFEAIHGYTHAYLGGKGAQIVGGRPYLSANLKLRLNNEQLKKARPALDRPEPPKPSPRPPSSSPTFIISRIGTLDAPLEIKGENLQVITFGRDPTSKTEIQRGSGQGEIEIVQLNVGKDNDSVSQNQAVLFRDQRENVNIWYFVDLGNPYGTYVNRQPLTPGRRYVIRAGSVEEGSIAIGSEIQFGDPLKPYKFTLGLQNSRDLPTDRIQAFINSYDGKEYKALETGHPIPPAQAVVFPFQDFFPLFKGARPEEIGMLSPTGKASNHPTGVIPFNPRQGELVIRRNPADPNSPIIGRIYSDAEARWVLVRELGAPEISVNGNKMGEWTFLNRKEFDRSDKISWDGLEYSLVDDVPRSIKEFSPLPGPLPAPHGTNGVAVAPVAVPTPVTSEATQSLNPGAAASSAPAPTAPPALPPVPPFTPIASTLGSSPGVAPTTSSGSNPGISSPLIQGRGASRVTGQIVLDQTQVGVVLGGSVSGEHNISNPSSVHLDATSPGISRNQAPTDRQPAVTMVGISTAQLFEPAERLPFDYLGRLPVNEPPLTIKIGSEVVETERGFTRYRISKGLQPAVSGQKVHVINDPNSPNIDVEVVYARKISEAHYYWYLINRSGQTIVPGTEAKTFEKDQLIPLDQYSDFTFVSDTRMIPGKMELTKPVPQEGVNPGATQHGVSRPNIEAENQFPIEYLSSLSEGKEPMMIEVYPNRVRMRGNQNYTRYLLGKNPEVSEADKGFTDVMKIDHGDIENTHAEIFFSKDPSDQQYKWFLKDHTTLIFVDGTAEPQPFGKPIPLHHGRVIFLGKPSETQGGVKVIFKIPGEGSESTPPPEGSLSTPAPSSSTNPVDEFSSFGDFDDHSATPPSAPPTFSLEPTPRDSLNPLRTDASAATEFNEQVNTGAVAAFGNALVPSLLDHPSHPDIPGLAKREVTFTPAEVVSPRQPMVLGEKEMSQVLEPLATMDAAEDLPRRPAWLGASAQLQSFETEAPSCENLLLEVQSAASVSAPSEPVAPQVFGSSTLPAYPVAPVVEIGGGESVRVSPMHQVTPEAIRSSIREETPPSVESRPVETTAQSKPAEQKAIETKPAEEPEAIDAAELVIEEASVSSELPRFEPVAEELSSDLLTEEPPQVTPLPPSPRTPTTSAAVQIFPSATSVSPRRDSELPIFTDATTRLPGWTQRFIGLDARGIDQECRKADNFPSVKGISVVEASFSDPEGIKELARHFPKETNIVFKTIINAAERLKDEPLGIELKANRDFVELSSLPRRMNTEPDQVLLIHVDTKTSAPSSDPSINIARVLLGVMKNVLTGQVMNDPMKIVAPLKISENANTIIAIHFYSESYPRVLAGIKRLYAEYEKLLDARGVPFARGILDPEAGKQLTPFGIFKFDGAEADPIRERIAVVLKAVKEVQPFDNAEFLKKLIELFKTKKISQDDSLIHPDEFSSKPPSPPSPPSTGAAPRRTTPPPFPASRRK